MDGNFISPTDCEEFIEELFKAVEEELSTVVDEYIEKLDELPAVPDKKHEWVDVVKKRDHTKRKWTDVATRQYGNLLGHGPQAREFMEWSDLSRLWTHKNNGAALGSSTGSEAREHLPRLGIHNYSGAALASSHLRTRRRRKAW